MHIETAPASRHAPWAPELSAAWPAGCGPFSRNSSKQRGGHMANGTQVTSTGTEALRLKLDEQGRSGARIKVVGVGGGGSNAVNRMVAAGFDGVEFLIANTDVQALHLNAAPNKLQIGAKLTKGLGAGADPNVGREAALEDTEKLIEAL